MTKGAEANRRYKAKRLAAGLCSYAGCSERTGGQMCEAHRLLVKARNARRPKAIKIETDPLCKVAGCNGPVHARGFCKTHYVRVMRHGTTELQRPIVGWSRNFERCIGCGTDTIPHVGKGLCRKCAQTKYSTGHRTKSRLRALKRYGLTPEGFEALWNAQDGRCKICQRQPEAKLVMKGKRLSHSLHIDHDHVTKVIRGLLCDSCNRGMGFFFDDPDLLIAAAAYLKACRAVAAELEDKMLN